MFWRRTNISVGHILHWNAENVSLLEHAAMTVRRKTTRSQRPPHKQLFVCQKLNICTRCVNMPSLCFAFITRHDIVENQSAAESGMARLSNEGVKPSARGLNNQFFSNEVAQISDNFQQIEGYTMDGTMLFHERAKEERHNLKRARPI